MATNVRVLILEEPPEASGLLQPDSQRTGLTALAVPGETEPEVQAGLGLQPNVVLADFTMPKREAERVLRLPRWDVPSSPTLSGARTQVEGQAKQTRRKGAAERVVQKDTAEEQFRLQASALAAAANGIFITDRAGKILWVNPAFAALTGYAQEEVLGQHCRILKSGQHAPEFYRDLWETILAGKVWRGELINRRKDGSHYSEMRSITPVRDDQGAITHFIAIQQDITEHKLLEAQFLQAQKMEAFGRLTGGVAHDFNNLLTVICGFSDVLLNTLPEYSPARDMVAQVKQAGERATGLTRQLLAFSRKQAQQFQVLNLNKELAEVQRLLGCLLGPEIQLVFKPCQAECPVWAEPTQLQQVILNLAANARDAMPHGGTLTIATRKVDLDEQFTRGHAKAQVGPHVLLEVSDTGCGMPSEVLGHIFEPFFTTKEPGKGTGLGLATVFGIVEQSQGFIEVESKPAQGTLFRIYLPRATAATAAKPAQPTATPERRRGETLLVVEDDEGVRNLTCRILRSNGYTVLEASDGEYGLEVFGHHDGSIHLVLTDVVLPHMDGCQMAEQLTAQVTKPKVLYMSGHLDDTLVSHGIQERGFPFLRKPFHAAALLAKVREVLDRHEETGTLPEACAAAV